jgi:hypothetical protein
MYGDAATRAAIYAQNGMSPRSAWDRAMAELSSSASSRNKVCPRSAYLALCESGSVVEVNAGDYDNATGQNGKYALSALRILRSSNSRTIDKQALWAAVAPDGLKHNQQMDVVIALWENGLLYR